MQAKWTEFIQEGLEMLGMKLTLLTRRAFFSLVEMYKTLSLHYIFHVSYCNSFFLSEVIL